MLSAIREKATGWIAWMIVILISIPFALWGVNSYFEGATQIVIAVANGVEIEQSDYQRALAQKQRQLVQLAGRDLGTEYLDSPVFKRQVVDSMIDEALAREFSRDRGFRISDNQLNRFIRTTEAFHTNGQFDNERYERLIGNAGLSVQGFQAQQRQQLTTDQMRISLAETAFVSQTELNYALKLLNQKRSAVYAILLLEHFLEGVKITDEDISNEFDAKRSVYFEPPQARVAYVELSVARLAAAIKIDDSAVKKHYDDAPRRYSKPGSRSASHILLPLVPGAAAEEAVRAKAARLVSEARGGADFAELARTYSKDAGSATRGGDLGVIQKGAMVPPFEKAVFALSAGEISEPVKTEFGYHVIKVTRVSKTEAIPFEEVREDIATALRRRGGEAEFVQLAEQLGNIAFEQPDSLEPLTDQLGLAIQTSDWFSGAMGTGIAANPKVRKAAFSDEVLVDGLNSGVIEINPDTLIVFRKLEHRERRPMLLEEVSDQIKTTLENRQAMLALEQAGNAILTALTDGTPWAELLGRYGLVEASLPAAVEEITDPQEQAIAVKVFAAPHPGAGAPVFGGGQISPEVFAIYRLDAVTMGDPSAVEQEEREQVRTAILRRQGDLLFDGFRADLRKAADVKIFDDRL